MVSDYTSHEFLNTRKYLNKDITVELDNVATIVMCGSRIHNRDPYLIDVCIMAIREIQMLRRQVKQSQDFLGGPMS